MTRIGTVKAQGGGLSAWLNDPAMPFFRLVIEGGGPSLGCWRCVGMEDSDWRGPKLKPAKYIFVRVS